MNLTVCDLRKGMKFVSKGVLKSEYEIVSIGSKSLTIKRIADGKEIPIAKKKILDLIDTFLPPQKSV